MRTPERTRPPPPGRTEDLERKVTSELVDELTAKANAALETAQAWTSTGQLRRAEEYRIRARLLRTAAAAVEHSAGNPTKTDEQRKGGGEVG